MLCTRQAGLSADPSFATSIAQLADHQGRDLSFQVPMFDCQGGQAEGRSGRRNAAPQERHSEAGASTINTQLIHTLFVLSPD